MDDEELVGWQIGRPARAFGAVSVRCPHGYPAVTRQRAETVDGVPFPTAFYLTCPWLVAAVSRIEAAGGVTRWTERVADDLTLQTSLEAGHEAHRELRPGRPAAIAGVADESQIKCLHAHVAFALASPGYALGEAMLAEIDEPWCPDARCAAASELDG